MTKHKHILPVIALVVVFAMWLIAVALVHHWFSLRWTDAFAGTNPFFTVLTFIGLMLSFYIHDRERREDKVSDDHERMEDKVKDRFFQLLHSLRDTVRDTQYDYDEKMCKPYIGILAFMRMENTFLGEVNGRPGNYLGELRPPVVLEGKAHHVGILDKIPALPITTVRQAFSEFYEDSAGGQLGHVIRMHHQILLLVDKSNLIEEDKSKLIEIYKATLSDPELHLILYYGLSSFVEEGYHELIEKYRLLNGLSYKERRFIWGRIPEIEHYKGTNADFINQKEKKS